jgi:hypothetical protein
MKNTLILFVLLTNILCGQDTTRTKARTKEYYLTFADFSPFTIHLKYKKQISQKTFFKLGLINLSGSYNEYGQNNPLTSPVGHTNYSGGLQIGLEFRKVLSNKFTLFHGPNINYTYQKSIFRNIDPTIPASQQRDILETHTGSVPYSLGLLFNLSANILVSAEINPSINYVTNTAQKGQNPLANTYSNSIGFSLDNRYGLISLVYRL